MYRLLFVLTCKVSSHGTREMVKTIAIGGLEEHLPAEHAQYEDVFTAAGDVMKHALDILNEPDYEEKKGGWKLDCSSPDVTIHYMDKSSGRYFAGRCKIKISAKDMNAEFWDNLDRNHEWNDNIRQARRVKKLSANTDYFHYTSNDVFIIKSREVLAARAFREINGSYILASRSIALPKEIPESKGSVRAHLHISVSRTRPDPEDPAHSCIYDYVICTDLKGMMFRSAVNQVMGRATLKDMENIRQHANTVLRPKLYPGLQ
ncbi:hypothetical protein PENTCL1PPCAC_21284 [Pristionchus entomophagus]|uniref:START domain-containing protein n=1 Tax=Pristionchus entomophagus TaxID=358040 RepID=A0AAV5TXZ2_9BILA|nr:hypothetical protein PENTCL1PPCAC_21284 [Pristionchus entomophagus]